MPDTTLRRRREMVVILTLTALVGGGALLFLLLIGGDVVLSMLTALAVLFLLGCVQYLLWGRGQVGDRGGPLRVDGSRPHQGSPPAPFPVRDRAGRLSRSPSVNGAALSAQKAPE